MDKRKARRLDRIVNGAGEGADPDPEQELEEAEEAEEEGQWEGMERTTTKGHCTGRGDNYYNDYTPPHPDSEAAAALFNSKLGIPFAFGPRYAGSPPRSRG